MAEMSSLNEYAMTSGSTVYLNLRLRGGKFGQNCAHGTTLGASASNTAYTKGPTYRNVLQGDKSKAATASAAQAENSPKPYIVE